MAICQNTIPLEEGAAARRPGLNYAAHTRGGVFGVLREFQFSQNLPYNIEFTPGHIRFVFGNNLVLEPTTQQVTAISTATPAVISTALDHGWSTGDEVQFNLPAAATDVGTHLLYNRQFLITVIDATHFSIADSVTTISVPGTSLVLGPLGTMVSRVLDFATPYVAADLPGLRVIQVNQEGEESVVILSQGNAPMQLKAISNPDQAFNTFATFLLTTLNFIDGPYLDPVADGGVVTPSAKTGVITLTASYQSWSSIVTYALADTVVYSGVGYISLIDSNLNNEPDVSSGQWQAQSPGSSVSPSGFVATDVGRSIRLFSAPAAWSKATAYALGATVEFDGSYWTALVANTGNQPGLDVVNWGIDTAAAVWTWGRIQSVVSTTQVTLQLLGGPLLYTTAINVWQVGRYSVTTGFPCVGVFMEGRLWLAGYQYPNHYDASMSNLPFQYSPSGPDGTVADDNGISETLNDDSTNPIFWMIPDANGIVMGTQEGEWLTQASALNDPLTPTSIQSKKVTKYGMENVEPRRSGITFMVVQRYARKLLEFMLNVYSGKYEAMNVSLKARDIATSGIAEIAYQRERTPIVWARMNDGTFAGMTYKRERSFQSNGPTFFGWHEHPLGTGRTVTALQEGASPGGELDVITIITSDGTPTGYWIEVLTDIADEEDTALDAFNLDGACRPFGSQTATVDGVDGIYLYGYYYLAGKTIQVWGGGLDLGDFTVAADGSVFVPFGADGAYTAGFYGGYSPALFTPTYLEQLATEGNDFNNLGIFVSNGEPAAVTAPNTAGISQFTGNTYQVVVSGVASSFVDWKNKLFYVPGESSGSVFGLSQYSIPALLPTGAVSNTALGIGVGPGVCGQDGNLYFRSDSANTGPFAKITNGLSFVSSFGADSSNETSSQAGMALPYSMCAISCFDQYVVQTGLLTGNAVSGGGGVEFAVVNGTTMEFQSSYGGDQAHGGICAGKQTNDGRGHYYGEAYSLLNNTAYYASNGPYSSLGVSSLSFWRVALNVTAPSHIPTIGHTNIATITPVDIDPTWYGISQSQGICFDQTDGNVLAVAQTSNTITTWSYNGNGWTPGYLVVGSNGHVYKCIEVVGNVDPTGDAGVHWTDLGAKATITNTIYLYKVNSSTGSVMWVIPLSGNPADDQNWNQSLVQNGRIALLCEVSADNQNVYWIDTIGGTIITTTAIEGCLPEGQQMWGANVGLIFAVNYEDSGSHPPVPLPVLPATGSFENCWGFFEAEPITPTQMYGPFVVGYTYTSEGMILRPIAPEVSGARNGPALGKTRRTTDAAWLLHNTNGLSFGVDFDTMRPMEFKAGGPQTVTPMTPLQLYSDVYWDKVDSDYTFNSMPCWRVTRPYPVTVLAVEAFLETQDR
jgi:hypothetical protein